MISYQYTQLDCAVVSVYELEPAGRLANAWYESVPQYVLREIVMVVPASPVQAKPTLVPTDEVA